MDGFDIASKIVDDICDRKGLKSAWHSIDDSTQEDIIETWSSLIDDELAAANKAIVALSEGLKRVWGEVELPDSLAALLGDIEIEHAPAIEKARGG